MKLASIGLLLALAWPTSGQNVEVVEASWENGNPRESCEVVRDTDGGTTRHGACSRWHENGKLAAEGKFADDKECGTWTYYHENGKRESRGRFRDGERIGKWLLFHDNGKKRGEGKFKDGRPHGPWKYWHEDGEPDPNATADYDFVVTRYRSGAERSRGPTKNGLRHGEWSFLWESGAPQFAGSFAEGKRTGEWRFHHADGTHDPRMLTGTFEAGIRQVRDDQVTIDTTAPSFTGTNLFTLYDLRNLAGTTAPETSTLIDRALTGDIEKREEALGLLWGRGREVVPAVLLRLADLDFTQEDVRRQVVDGYERVLKAACCGRSFGWPASFLTDATGNDGMTLRRWLSLYTLTRVDHDYWQLDLGTKIALVGRTFLDERLLFTPTFPDGGPSRMARQASPRAAAIYAPRFATMPATPETQAALNALDWLVANQRDDGSWKYGDGANPTDKHLAGCTGLAVLSLMAGGNTTREGPHREAVRRGVQWLMDLQDKGGLVASPRYFAYVYDHGIATLALCEAATFSDSQALRARAQLALHYIHLVRVSDESWNYEMGEDDRCDTSITCWMAQALAAGVWAGLTVEDQVLYAGPKWVDRMTDSTSGVVGYDSAGSMSSRTPTNEHFPRDHSQAMSAAGYFVRTLVGESPDRGGTMKKYAAVVRRCLPHWRPEQLTCDMYYWFYGCQAMHQAGGRNWTAWSESFHAAALAGQVVDGEHAGSWDPVGPWGFKAGRVYATSMMTLGLLAPRRLARLATLN